MNPKNVTIAGVAAGITLFALGGLFYVLLLGDFFMKNQTVSGTRDEPLFAGIIIGELICGFVMAAIYEKWAQGNYSWQNGMIFGATIALLLAGGLGLINFSANGLMTSTGWLADLGISLLRYSIAGLVIATVFSKLDKPANP